MQKVLPYITFILIIVVVFLGWKIYKTPKEIVTNTVQTDSLYTVIRSLNTEINDLKRDIEEKRIERDKYHKSLGLILKKIEELKNEKDFISNYKYTVTEADSIISDYFNKNNISTTISN